MKRFAVLAAGFALLFATAAVAGAATAMVRMADRAPVPFGAFVDDLRRADVVFIGDTHDDGRLHGKQVEIIRALYEKNPQLAIGLEMFTAENQRHLDDWTGGKTEEKDFVAFYAKNWSYDWRLYRDLFIFARDNHIPMIALNVPKGVAFKVVRQGSRGLSETDRQLLPPGGPWKLGARQAEYLKRIREQAFRNAPTPFPLVNFEEAQALRNQTMAYRIAKFREKSPKSTVAVIAGTWHAIKNGAPESLKDYGHSTCKVVLPDLPDFAWLKLTAEEVDYLIPARD